MSSPSIALAITGFLLGVGSGGCGAAGDACLSSLSITLAIIGLLLGVGYELSRAARARTGRRDPPRPPVAGWHRPLREGFHPRRHAELRAIAQARADALLKQWLSAVQHAQYEREQHFDVVGAASGIRYRIHHGAQFNVEELDD